MLRTGGSTDTYVDTPAAAAASMFPAATAPLARLAAIRLRALTCPRTARRAPRAGHRRRAPPPVRCVRAAATSRVKTMQLSRTRIRPVVAPGKVFRALAGIRAIHLHRWQQCVLLAPSRVELGAGQ